MSHGLDTLVAGARRFLVTRRGFARSVAVALAALSADGVDAAAARRRDISGQKGKKRRKPAMLVLGDADGAIYRRLAMDYRMVRWNGRQQVGRYAGLVIDHQHHTVESLREPGADDLARTAFWRRVPIHFLNTDENLHRSVHLGQFGSIVPHEMPAMVMWQAPAAHGGRGQIMTVGWPTFASSRTGGREVHATPVPRRKDGGAGFERDYLAFTAQVANARDRQSRQARGGGSGRAANQTTGVTIGSMSMPASGGAVGNSFLKTTTFESTAITTTPIFGVGDATYPYCPGWNGVEGICFTAWFCAWYPSYYITGDESYSYASRPPYSGWSHATGTGQPLSHVSTVARQFNVLLGLVPVPPSSSALPQLQLYAASYLMADTGDDSTATVVSDLPQTQISSAASWDVVMCWNGIDSGGSQCGVDYCDPARQIDSLVGYHTELAFGASVQSSGGAPQFTLAASGALPPDENDASEITTGTNRTEGFSIGATFGAEGKKPTIEVGGDFSDEWEWNNEQTIKVPNWYYETGEASTAYYVKDLAGNFNARDCANPATQCAGGLTTDTTSLNGLQQYQNAVSGEAPFVATPNGQGSIDVVMSFSYTAGAANNLVNLYDNNVNMGIVQSTSVLSGDTGDTFVFDLSQPIFNPPVAPVTFTTAWNQETDPNSDPVTLTYVITPDPDADPADYMTTIAISPTSASEDAAIPSADVTPLSVNIYENGSVVATPSPSQVLGEWALLQKGQTMEITFSCIGVQDVPYALMAMTTSANYSKESKFNQATGTSPTVSQASGSSAARDRRSRARTRGAGGYRRSRRGDDRR